MTLQRGAVVLPDRPTLAVCFGLLKRFDSLDFILSLSPNLAALQEQNPDFCKKVKKLSLHVCAGSTNSNRSDVNYPVFRQEISELYHGQHPCFLYYAKLLPNQIVV